MFTVVPYRYEEISANGVQTFETEAAAREWAYEYVSEDHHKRTAIVLTAEKAVIADYIGIDLIVDTADNWLAELQEYMNISDDTMRNAWQKWVGGE